MVEISIYTRSRVKLRVTIRPGWPKAMNVRELTKLRERLYDLPNLSASQMIDEVNRMIGMLDYIIESSDENSKSANHRPVQDPRRKQNKSRHSRPGYNTKTRPSKSLREILDENRIDMLNSELDELIQLERGSANNRYGSRYRTSRR